MGWETFSEKNTSGNHGQSVLAAGDEDALRKMLSSSRKTCRHFFGEMGMQKRQGLPLFSRSTAGALTVPPRASTWKPLRRPQKRTAKRKFGPSGECPLPLAPDACRHVGGRVGNSMAGGLRHGGVENKRFDENIGCGVCKGYFALANMTWPYPSGRGGNRESVIVNLSGL